MVDSKNTQSLQSGLMQNEVPLTIDLSLAAVDKEFNIAGNYFYIKDSPDLTSYISIKINSTGSSAITWAKQTGFVRPFNKLYITTPAGQAGMMTIIIASLATEFFQIIDNRSAISQGMEDLLSELRGITAAGTDGAEKTVGLAAGSILAANAARKGGILQAKSTNTGIIYIAFTDGVTSARWVVELQPGMSWAIDDYRGPLYAIADTAAQLLGWGEW